MPPAVVDSNQRGIAGSGIEKAPTAGIAGRSALPPANSSQPQTLQDLISALGGRGTAPAIIAFGREATDIWSFARLASTIAQLSAGLAARGIRPGQPVGILAPNSPRWVATYMAVVRAGAIAMPLDERADDAEVARLLTTNDCRWLATTVQHAERISRHLSGHELTAILLDGGTGPEAKQLPWDSLLITATAPLPATGPSDVAAIAHTSGTTGTPKAVPLTHANLMSNIAALLGEHLVRGGDRALLPLPLHHVYPMTVGMLMPLAAGVALVLPAGLSGPELTTALREGGVTHLLGVPRLYVALLDGIRAQLRARGGVVARWVARLLALSTLVAKRFRVRIGRVVFYPLHRRLAPRLRLLVSGGAALDVDTQEALQGLGWEVLSGYGLTETSPILTFTRRRHTPPGSAGLPLPGVELRIVEADAQGVGEIQARGASVFSGYLHNPEATAAAFTADGWFRTGDLGRLDKDGYLYISARKTETIVRADGQKIFPETVEAVYADSPLIQELAILGHQGKLVALVVPNLEAIRARGGTRAEELIRDELAERGRALPAYQRLSGVAIVHEGLPRTQLGKPRRFLLPAIYERALRRGPGEAPPEMSEQDRALLAAPAAARLWAWLTSRFPDRHLTLDTSPQLDLGVDSLGWVNLSLEMEQALGVTLSEAAIARVMTLRDLVREVVTASEHPAAPSSAPPVDTARLDPGATGPAAQVIGRALAALNRLLMRGLFRVRVAGAGNLPAQGPFIICANHTSYLDPLALAAALPYGRLRRTWWAGWTGILFTGRLQRAFSRIAQVIPIDPDRAAASSLAWGGAVLDHGHSLVWFPEGSRSRDGTLQRFLPGIGALLAKHPVPVVPVHIAGAFAAWPRDRRFPRLHPVTVTIGAPAAGRDLLGHDAGTSSPEEIAARVRELVARAAG